MMLAQALKYQFLGKGIKYPHSIAIIVGNQTLIPLSSFIHFLDWKRSSNSDTAVREKYYAVRKRIYIIEFNRVHE